MIAAADLQPDHRILEIGCGLGRFTLPLTARGYRVTANDLSPILLGRLDDAAPERLATVCCDVHDIAAHVEEPFDRIVGFFVLHHLVDFVELFETLKGILRPGGRLALCEPVGINPLYHLQVALARSMSYRGEPSLVKMRTGVILPALRSAGLSEATSSPYGYFPPALRNRRWGARFERWLEAAPWIPIPHAFQIFSACSRE